MGSQSPNCSERVHKQLELSAAMNERPRFHRNGSSDVETAELPDSNPKIPVMQHAALWLVTAVLLIPNVLGSVVNVWYNRIYIDSMLAPAEQLAFQQTTIVFNLIVYPVALLAWLYAMLSLKKPLSRLLRNEPVDAEQLHRARRRLLNLPWWAAGIGIIGWLLCIPVFPMAMTLLAGPLQSQLYWHLPISFAVAGLMAITQGYFAVELTAQRLLYPTFFRDAYPTDTKGVLPVSLRMRGIVMAISVGLCPVVTVILPSVAPHTAGAQHELFIVCVGGIGVVFGLAISWMVGRLIAEPIQSLRHAAGRVTAGDLNVQVQQLRADEFGPMIKEFNKMVVELREKEQLRETFGLHVGRRAAQQILRRDPGRSGVEEIVTVMFMDIRGFTARAARCTPNQVVGLLNALLTEMVSVVEDRYQGMVNKFLGDGFMAIFGAGDAIANHANSATCAGIEMLDRLKHFNLESDTIDQEPIRIGIGIHTGPAIVGCIGSPSRLEYTAIGDTVNLASRVEGLTKVMNKPLLISEATRAELDPAINTERLAPQTVKGQPQPVSVHNVPEQILVSA